MSAPRWSLHFAWGRAPYALDLPEVLVGRGDTCPLQIEEPAAAAEHARFIVDDGDQVWLEHVAPTGQTLVNGHAITTRTRLDEGDFIQIGTSVLNLRPTKGRLVSSSAAQTLIADGPPPEVVRALEGRDEHRTIEADAGELLAAIRNASLSPASLPTSPSPPPSGMSTPSSPMSARASVTMPTLMGLGPAEPTGRTEGSVRMKSNSDLTPLPAPLPAPPVSIADLGALLREANERSQSRTERGEITFGEPSSEGSTTGTLEAKTGQISAPAKPAHVELSAARTLPPMRSPVADKLPNAPTVAPRGVPAEVTALTNARRTPPGPTSPATAMPATSPAVVTPPAATAPPATSPAASTAPPVSRRQAAVTAPSQEVPYLPPPRGGLGSFSRAFAFLSQMRALARREPSLTRPIWLNLAIATPVSLGISLLLLLVHAPAALYAVLAIGTALLYFVDYACNALTASLLHDYLTTGRADPRDARARMRASLSGVLLFAAVSALLDVASTYARERRDLLSRVLTRILHVIWTTATYVIMPAMVIERTSFGAALARSKRLMDHDPTGVGAGIVAVSLCSYLCALVVFPLAYFALQLGGRLHPVLGAVLFFMLVNIYWAFSGWLKITYSTCFYLWARRCETEGRADATLAPTPLRHAIDAG